MTNYYFDLKTWTISTTKTERSVTLPLLVVLLLAPVLGAGFLMFMPTIGFILLFNAMIIRPVKKWCRREDSNLHVSA